MSNLKQIPLAEGDPNDVELTLPALAEHNLANEIYTVRAGTERYPIRTTSSGELPAPVRGQWMHLCWGGPERANDG